MPTRTLRTRLWSVLSGRRATLFVVASSLILAAPSIGNGLSMDDHFQRALAGGYAPIRRGPADLYRFISGEPAEHLLLLDRGFLPWFSAEGLKLAFFRPLSSLSVYFDDEVLPHLPWLFHIESLALYGALVALVLSLYRAILPTAPLAALAGLLFAVDDAHGMAVGWLANRNALFAAVFGIGAVLLHHRATSRAFRLGWVVAPVCFGLALLSGEAGLGAFAYLVAYALAFDPAPLGRRLVSLTPYVVVIITWWVAARWLGAGVRGSGFYVDPAEAPLRFLATFPGRALVLLLAQVGLPPAEFWFVWAGLPWMAQMALTVLGLGVVGAVAWAFAPLLREDRGARFCAIGMGLALCLPTLTAPADRNLLLTGVGAFGLIALFIGSLAISPTLPRAQLWLRGAFIGVHLVVAPLVLPLTSLMPGLIDFEIRERLTPFRGDPALSAQTLVAVNMPNLVVNAFYWATPANAGEPSPSRVRALAPTTDRVKVTREDERTLLVTLSPGYFADPRLVISRDPEERFSEGDRVATPGVTFTVERVDGGGRPLAVRCQFEMALEDPSLRWVAWDGAALIAFRPPEIGATAWSSPP